MAAAVALSSSGVEWLACDVPCETADQGLASDDAHDEEGDTPCGPSSPECSCCFNLRLAVPDTRIAILERAAEPFAPVAINAFIPDPSADEILHVPRAC
jgi:hypothetical protein